MDGESGREQTRGRSKLRRALLGLAILVGTVIVLVIVAKVWVAPLIIENQIATHVGQVCNGEIHVSGTRLGFDGQVTADDLTVTDSQGRSRVRVRDLRANLGGLSTLSPYVSKFTAGSLEVNFYRDDSEPFFKAARGASGGEPRLEAVTIDNIVVTAHSDATQAAWIGGARLSAIREQHIYRVSFKSDSNSPGDRIDVGGTIDPRSESLQLHGRIARAIGANQAAVTLAWTALPSEYNCYGRVEADMSVSGSWRDLAGFRTRGHVDFNDVTFTYRGAALVSGLRFPCDVNDSRWGGRFEGRLLNGALTGTVALEHAGLTPTAGQMSVEAEQADLGRLAKEVPGWHSFTQGVASARYRGTFERPALADVNGAGALYIKGIEAHLLPIISQVLDAVGVSESNLLGDSDAIASFANKGPAVTIEDGSVANAVSAIKVEPGGRLNLQEQHVDFYAVWLPLKQVNSVLNAVPVVNLFSNLKDKLIRVHVKGQWDEPASKLISKEPVKDISEGVLDFFKGAAKEGGRIPKKLFDALGSIVK